VKKKKKWKIMKKKMKIEIQNKEILDTVQLKRSIYLTIMSSVNFEEVVHKLIKGKLTEGREMEVCSMIIECCSQERTYLKFYGLMGQRFCQLNNTFQEKFDTCFKIQYSLIHRLEINKMRNVSTFFAHLLFSDAISWSVLEYIHLNQNETTSSSRIFIKILFQSLAENLGSEKLNTRLQDDYLSEHFKGLFPTDTPKNLRFSINFFTSIGLGRLTEKSREILDKINKKNQEELNKDDSDEEDDSDDSDSGSDSESE